MTIDKVFLLSLDEVCHYFGDSMSGLIKKRDTYIISDENDSARRAEHMFEGPSHWWLRSPGYKSDYVAYVQSSGSVSIRGEQSGIYTRLFKEEFRYQYLFGIRPAMWIKL